MSQYAGYIRTLFAGNVRQFDSIRFYYDYFYLVSFHLLTAAHTALQERNEKKQRPNTREKEKLQVNL